MANVKISSFAAVDLEEIWSYIAANDQNSAHNTINDLLKKFRLLAQNSALGKNRNDLLINLCSFPHKRYIIFYFPIQDGVEIYRVIHSSRDIESIFTDYFEGLGE